MANAPLLDPKFLERLERLTIHWQKSFPGLVGGHNRSRFAGGGQEFLDHRQFHQGDDLRAVNWRAFMRLDKMFLKMFQIEPRVPVRLLLDTSASMAAGDGAKFDYARRLAGALCYVGLVRLDTIEILPFASTLKESKTSGGGRHQFNPVSRYLEGLTASGTTSFINVAREYLNEYPQRGLVIVISDFLDDENCERALQFLGDYGNELMLVQLWADDDRVPHWNGECEFVDAETNVSLHMHVDKEARARYTEEFDKFAASVRAVAVRNQGRYAGLPISEPIEDAIFGNLMRSQTA